MLSMMWRRSIAGCLLVDPGTTQFRIGNPKRGRHHREDLPPIWLWPEAGPSPRPQTDKEKQQIIAPHHAGLFDGFAIRDFEEAEEFAKSRIKSVAGWRSNLIRPGCLVSVPSSSLFAERRAMEDLMDLSGCRRVFLVEAPMAAAIGAGWDVASTVPTMIGLLGAARSEFAAVSDRNFVAAAGSRSGWNGLLLNCATQSRRRSDNWPDRARFEQMLQAYDGENDRSLSEQFGLSNDVLHAEFDAEALRIAASFYSVFDRLRPSEQVSVRQKGATLAGGLAENAYLVSRLSHVLGLTLRVASAPRDCVYLGLMKIRELAREGSFGSKS